MKLSLTLTFDDACYDGEPFETIAERLHRIAVAVANPGEDLANAIHVGIAYEGRVRSEHGDVIAKYEIQSLEEDVKPAKVSSAPKAGDAETYPGGVEVPVSYELSDGWVATRVRVQSPLAVVFFRNKTRIDDVGEGWAGFDLQKEIFLDETPFNASSAQLEGLVRAIDAATAVKEQKGKP